jgi:hypothetical protein
MAAIVKRGLSRSRNWSVLVVAVAICLLGLDGWILLTSEAGTNGCAQAADSPKHARPPWQDPSPPPRSDAGLPRPPDVEPVPPPGLDAGGPPPRPDAGGPPPRFDAGRPEPFQINITSFRLLALSPEQSSQSAQRPCIEAPSEHHRREDAGSGF